MTGEPDGNDPPVRPGDGDEPQLDVDTAFAAIVAGWANDTAPAERNWPSAEDLEDERGGRPEAATAPTSPAGPSAPPQPEDDDTAAIVLPLGTGGGPRDADPDTVERAERAEAEEGFVPPEPPPLPRGDMITRLLWAATIGGPLFLLIAAVAWQDAPDLLIAAAVACFVGGFVGLVVRMPRDRGDDDDGAVV